MAKAEGSERVIDCTLRIKEITDNDGVTISKATIKQHGVDIEIPITVLYNGPSTLGNS